MKKRFVAAVLGTALVTGILSGCGARSDSSKAPDGWNAPAAERMEAKGYKRPTELPKKTLSRMEITGSFWQRKLCLY